MNVIDTTLEPNRRCGGDFEQLALLPVAEIPAIYHPTVGLLKSVAVRRNSVGGDIGGEEREIGEQVEFVILGVRIREEPPAGLSVVVIIQPCRASDRFASFGRINRTEPIQ